MATADSMARLAAAKRAAKTATKKKTTSSPNMSADRLSQLKRTQTRAGKGVGNVAQRAKQNAGVKDGTIRKGAGGKFYNVFDSKTQTWKRGQAVGAKKTASATSTPATSTKSLQFGGIRKPTSKTVGPAAVGIKNPRDGAEYRFGGPGNMEVFRWNAKTKKFTYVRKHTPKTK